MNILGGKSRHLKRGQNSRWDDVINKRRIEGEEKKMREFGK
jgi:hypothetical protein